MRGLRSLVVAVVVAAAAVTVWFGGVAALRTTGRASDADTRAALTSLARTSASMISEWQSSARAELENMTRTVEPWNGALSQITGGLLDKAVPAAADFDASAYIVDTSGKVVVATSNHADLIGQLRRTVPVDAALTDKPGLVGLAQDPLEHVLAMQVVAPLHDIQGHVTGALVGRTAIPGGTLWSQIVSLEHVLGRRAVVVSPDGIELDGTKTPPPGSVTVGTDLLAPVRSAARGAGVLTYAGDGGVRTAAAYAPALEGWVVAVPVTPSSLTSASRAVASRAEAWLAGPLIGAFAIIMLVELSRARTARDVDTARRELLAISGHELRTPLTLIKGFTQTLVTRWDRTPDVAKRQMVETIDRHTRNLEHLVNRLLLASEIDSGLTARSLSLRSIELAPMLEAVAEHQRALSPVHTITVHVRSGLRVRADRRGLEHIATHLVENAVKYSPAGGAIDIRAGVHRGQVRLVVEDEGIGLPSDTEAIFDKFVQREAADSRTYDEGGVGLGLYIVRNLTSMMHGGVRAERRSPRGARFVVTLPASDT